MEAVFPHALEPMCFYGSDASPAAIVMALHAAQIRQDDMHPAALVQFSTLFPGRRVGPALLSMSECGWQAMSRCPT